MQKRLPTISPELRQWILATTGAGHGVSDVLRLMKENGYHPKDSLGIVSEVMKIPLAKLSQMIARPTPAGFHPRHPEAPEVVVDGHAVGVSLSMQSPELRVLEDILTARECAELIELARPRLDRALVVDPAGNYQADGRRTSAGMFFALHELPLIQVIERRLAGLLGVPVNHGEALQVLHYLPGQEYEPHYDWFDPELPSFEPITAIGGQRIASVVIYLNTPQEGGGTAFPEVGVTVTARRGSAVYFAYEAGDRNSLHAGLPVIRGEKWIATKWLRQRPYLNQS